MKSDHNLVTEADLKIQTMVWRGLRAVWIHSKLLVKRLRIKRAK
jgi:3'-phosphoadenosine 5'-phosphosulfate (PAPS) 3'-phosphatase